MNRKLIQLLRDNRSRAKAIAPAARVIRAEAAREATIYIYDAIVSSELEAEYWGGVSSQALVPELRALDVDTVHLRIDSPGGDVFAAQAICTAIKQIGAKVIAHIDGLAASAATIIACACDEVAMADGAMYMIHNGWTIAWGDRHDFGKVVGLLEKIDGTIAEAYAKRTGQSEAEMSALMDAETWFTADEAIEIGLVDRKAEIKAKAQAWNLSAYAKAPPPPDPAPTDEPTEKPAPAGFFMSKTNANRLRLALLA